MFYDVFSFCNCTFSKLKYVIIHTERQEVMKKKKYTKDYLPITFVKI